MFEQSSLIFESGNFVLDAARLELRRGQERVAVQPKALKVLLHLVLKRHRPVSHEELLRTVWADETVTIASVKRAVRGARIALGDDGDSQSSIRTVRGCGYQLVRPVVERTAQMSGALPHVPASNAGSEGQRASSEHEAFVGRAGVLATIDAHLRDVASGRGRTILFMGEPGIGKTRTLLELARRAARSGAETWFGRCLEDEGAPAFWPWTQILRDGARDRASAELLSLMGSNAADIAEGIPELRQWLPDLPDAPAISRHSARFRFFDAIAVFLKRAAEGCPIVLLFDDLQRADQPTLRLISFVAHQLNTARVLIAGTLRPIASQPDAMRESLTNLVAEIPGTCLELEGLDCAEVESYLEARTGLRGPASVVSRLQRLTAGNPLFLEQLLNQWQSSGPRGVTNWDRLFLGTQTQGLSGAIARLLAELDEQSRQVLRVAAVFGSEFMIGRVASLLSKDPATLLPLLSPAKAAGILREANDAVASLHFTHVLIRDALYAELEPHERALLHGRAATLVESSGDSSDAVVAELAHHFGQAWPAHDAGKALHYTLLAADAAKGRLAYEEAAQHYDRGLQILANTAADPEQRLCLLFSKGEALSHAAEAEKARAALLEAIALARGLNSTHALARAARVMARLPESGKVDCEKTSVLREAMAGLPKDDPERAFLMALLAKATTYSDDSVQRSTLVFYALEESKRLTDPKLRAEALYQCHSALPEPDHLQEREAIAQELEVLALTHCDHRLLWYCNVAKVQNCLERGDIVLIDQAIATLEALATELREPVLRWQVTTFRAMRLYIAGELAAAEAAALNAWRMGACVGDEAARHSYCMHVTGWLRIAGRLSEAEALVREMAVRFPGLIGWRIVLTAIEADLGRPDAARRMLAEVMEDPRALHEPFTLSMLAPLSEICSYLGTAEMARVLYKRLLPYAQLWGNVTFAHNTYGPVQRHLGMLATRAGDLDAADAHFEDALARSEAADSPTFTALTLLYHARALLKRPTHEAHAKALQMLEICDRINRRCGFGGLSRLAARFSELAHGAPERAPV